MNEHAHLRARAPVAGTAPLAQPPVGLQKLPIGSRRDSYLYVPPHYDPRQPWPLVLLLHGAGGHAQEGLEVLRHLADQAGLILAAPASHAGTWDIIARRAYVHDLAMVDLALEYVLAHYAIDSRHLAIGGFSDGASYALTLGLANGELFSHILAFSPGFIGPMMPRGRPRVFVSHGDADRVLPIDPCARSIARQLRGAAYDLLYREFQGGHVIPPAIAMAALAWFLGQT